MTELDEIVEEMAALLDTPCILEDPDFRLISYSGQTDVDDVRQRSILERRSSAAVREWFHAQDIRTSPGPIRTPAQPALGIVARLCVPARHLNRVHGYFWLLDPEETIGEDSWSAASRLAEIAALLISQTTRRQTRLNLFFRDLVEGDRATARAAARELAAASGFGMNDELTCVLVQDLHPTMETLTQTPRNGTLSLQESPSITAILARGRIDASIRTVPDILGRLGVRRRALGHADSLVVGVGPVVPSLEEARRSRWGARTALRVAATDAEHRVVSWESLGALRLLSAAADQDLAEAMLTERLAGFLSDTRSEQLVRTARVYLASACSAAQTAASLNIHRQTLYHRLDQVERRTGLDLKSGADRTYLHLALLLAEYLVPAGSTFISEA